MRGNEHCVSCRDLHKYHSLQILPLYTDSLLTELSLVVKMIVLLIARHTILHHFADIRRHKGRIGTREAIIFVRYCYANTCNTMSIGSQFQGRLSSKRAEATSTSKEGRVPSTRQTRVRFPRAGPEDSFPGVNIKAVEEGRTLDPILQSHSYTHTT